MQFYNGDDAAPEVAPASVAAVQQALNRYKASALAAAEMCATDQGNLLQQAFEWITNTTFTESVCARAATMKENIDNYEPRVTDPATTDAQMKELLGFIQKETDISDLIDLYNSSQATTILNPKNPLTTIPRLIPWWAWAAGAVVVASALFGSPFERRH